MIKNSGTSGCYDLQLVKFKCAQIVISLCGVPSILSRIVWENGSCLGSESLVLSVSAISLSYGDQRVHSD